MSRALHLINHVEPATFFALNPGTAPITFEPEPVSEAGGVVAMPAAGPAPSLEAWSSPRRVLKDLHRMVSKASWPRGGALNDSSSVLLGADFDATGPRLSAHTAAMAALTKKLNSVVAASLRDPSFVWSSLLVEVRPVAACRALPFALGPALTLTHGKHSGSVWVSGCCVPSGKRVQHHATHSVHLSPFSGFPRCRLGVPPRRGRQPGRRRRRSTPCSRLRPACAASALRSARGVDGVD